MRRRDFMIAAGSLITAGALTGCGGVRPSAVVRTQSGQIQGEIAGGIHRFLGVPYAEPPFGKLRFKAPVPRKAWDGVYIANQYGSACPQTGPLQPGVPVAGEDCLNLNIWTPDPSATDLPVMVWVHGGGQVSGSGSMPLYDGTQFANEGVVLVTCNRRLGAEGYLYLEPAMGAGVGPGNLGVLDQIQMLRWLQENIAAFGGDAGNVTLFGQSGGAAVVQALVATPAARGLVRRVIPQSGSYAAQRPESAERITEFVLKQLAIEAGDLDTLRTVPSARLAAMYPAVRELGLGQPQPYLPVISESMPVHPADAAHAGFGLDLDYLTGSCADEARFFAMAEGAKTGSHFLQRSEQVLAAGEVDRQRLLSVYLQQRPDLSPQEAELAMLGDVRFRVPTLRVAQGHSLRGSGKTYCYYFAWSPPQIGAAHGLDLIMFGNGMPFKTDVETAEADEVGAFMRRAWSNFARNGDPSVAGLEWPQYNNKRQSTVAIDAQPRVFEQPFAQQSRILGRVMANSWQAMGL